MVNVPLSSYCAPGSIQLTLHHFPFFITFLPIFCCLLSFSSSGEKFSPCLKHAFFYGVDMSYLDFRGLSAPPWSIDHDALTRPPKLRFLLSYSVFCVIHQGGSAKFVTPISLRPLPLFFPPSINVVCARQLLPW